MAGGRSAPVLQRLQGPNQTNYGCTFILASQHLEAATVGSLSLFAAEVSISARCVNNIGDGQPRWQTAP